MKHRHPEDVEAIFSSDAVTTAKIWRLWNQLPDFDPCPVHRIAEALGIPTADVAAVVYPSDVFGAWADDQEPLR